MPAYIDFMSNVANGNVATNAFETERQGRGRGDLTTGVSLKIALATTGYRAEVAGLAPPANTALNDLNTCILVAVITP